MGRGVGKCQWQTIEVLAAFLAGEAACDARAQTTTKARGAAASAQFASWLRKLDKDDGMQSRGIKFAEKLVGKTAGMKTRWDVEASILARQGDILKQHKAVLAYIKRNIMPGYHTFFVANGEKAPSGKLRDDAIKAVLEHLWKQLEEDRVEKLAEKLAKKGAGEADKTMEAAALECEAASAKQMVEEPTPDTQPQAQADSLGARAAASLCAWGCTVLTAISDGGGIQDEDDVEDPSEPGDELHDDPNKSDGAAVRAMPEEWAGTKEYTVWLERGPLACQDDQSASLIGPGETVGKPRGQSSRAAQREAADSKGRKRPLGEAPGDSPEGAEHPTPSSQGSFTSPPPTSTPGALKVSLESLQDSNHELARMRAAIEAQAKVDELKMILEYDDDEASKAEVKKKLLKLLKERQGL